MNLKQAEALARYQLGRLKITRSWRVDWYIDNVSAGKCEHVLKQICFNKLWVLLNSKAHALDTILHEVAHALVGPDAGHNSIWRSRFMQLGGSGMIHAKENSAFAYMAKLDKQFIPDYYTLRYSPNREIQNLITVRDGRVSVVDNGVQYDWYRNGKTDLTILSFKRSIQKGEKIL